MNKHLIVLILAVGLLLPSLASAKISKELRAEAEDYLAKMAEEEESDAETLQAAMLSKARLQGKKAGKELTPILASEDRPLRFGAALALVAAGDKKAISKLVKELTSGGKLLETLESRVSVLDDKLEVKVYETLFKEGQADASREVIRYLATKDGTLGKLYVKALMGKDPALRKLAADAAVFWKNTGMLSNAEKLAKSKDGAARNDALRIALAISERKSTRTASLSLLAKLAQDATPATAEKAAKRLVELKDDRGTKALIKMVGASKGASKRTEIMQFLLAEGAKVGFKDVEVYLTAADNDEKVVAHQLAAHSKNADFLKKLLALEKSIEFDDRILAIQALGHSQSKSAGPVLSRTLFEGRVDVRIASAHSLKALGSVATLPALTRALKGERDPNVKLAVIGALGSVKSGQAISALRFLVTNNDLKIKMATIRSIRRIGLPEGSKVLDVLFRDRNREVQWLAFITALELDPAKGLKHLPTQIRNPSDDYIDQLTGLKGKTRKAVLDFLFTKAGGTAQSDAIRWAMVDGDWDDHLRNILTDSSTASGDRRALMIYFTDKNDAKGMMGVEKLVRSAKAKPLQHLAVWLLVRNPNKTMEPTFRGLLGSKDAAIRSVALYGILSVQ